MLQSSATTFYTQTELARVLGISRQRVGQLIAEGKLPEPTVRLGPARGYTREQVLDFMEQRRSDSTGRKEGSK